MEKEFISAFAFNIGKEIERWIIEQTNNLEYNNQILQAKILKWYYTYRDEEFAKYFGIKTHTHGE